MAKVVTITNPVTGQPAQVDQLDHTAQQIDDAVAAARWSHRNLLDNAYWANPDAIIDQRGGYVVPPNTSYYNLGNLAVSVGKLTTYATVIRYATYNDASYPVVLVNGTEYMTRNGTAVRGYVGAVYGTDRWYSTGGVVLINNGMIVITADSTNRYIRQWLENPGAWRGKVVTVSAMDSDGMVYSATGTIPEIASTTQISVCYIRFKNGGIYLQDGGDRRLFVQLRADANTSQGYKAAKLELGDKQTLAHQDENGNWVLNDPPPDKALELAKCQRYQFCPATTAAYQVFGIAVATSETTAVVSLSIPVSMRSALPTLICDATLFYLQSDSYIQAAEMTISSVSMSAAKIVVTVASGLTIGKSYLLTNGGNKPTFIIDANL